MDVEPPAEDEPLEAFYVDEAEEARRLAEVYAEVDREAKAVAPGGRRHGTVAGALMAGIAMGLRDVFEPEPHDRTAIEQPAPEQPLEPQKYEIHLDPVAPESSFAIYRPWIDGEYAPPAMVDDGAEAIESGPETARPASKPAETPKPKGGGAGFLGG